MLLAGDSYGGVQSAELAMQGQQAQNYWNAVRTMQANAQFAQQQADQQRARDMAQQNFLAQVDEAQRRHQDDVKSQRDWFNFQKTNQDRAYGLQKQAQDWQMTQPRDEKSFFDAINLTKSGIAPDQAAAAFNLPPSAIPRLGIVYNAVVKEWNDSLIAPNQLAADLNKSEATISALDQLEAKRLATPAPWFWQNDNKDAIKKMDADLVHLRSQKPDALKTLGKFGINNTEVGLQNGRYVPLRKERAFWTMPDANSPGIPTPEPDQSRFLATDFGPVSSLNPRLAPPASPIVPMVPPAANASPIVQPMPRFAPGYVPRTWGAVPNDPGTIQAYSRQLARDYLRQLIASGMDTKQASLIAAKKFGF